MGAVSVDHRGRHRARVADVGVGRNGGRGLQEAHRPLPAVGEGLGEIQGPRDERGDRRRGHRLPGSSRTLLLGRYDTDGRLQYVGRTTTLARAAGTAVADLLAAGRRGHPWTGWSFSAEWGSQEKLVVTLVEPELVVEVGVDVARDASGRWRHPARWHRPRPDLSPADVPLWSSPPR
ncbi:hypothetical protein [Streptomyces sp. CC53]|uniref:ATP dependent DNA ligase n=1 Tax=Streptomyces sp. CC53 TaxID=1906740 RepID=UPI00210E1504|nr:hypothetical protein [Streptomyces sp. CC53]